MCRNKMDYPRYLRSTLMLLISMLILLSQGSTFESIREETLKRFAGTIIFRASENKLQKPYPRAYSLTFSESSPVITPITDEDIFCWGIIANSTSKNIIIREKSKFFPLSQAKFNKYDILLKSKKSPIPLSLPDIQQGVLSPDGNQILFTCETVRKNKLESPLGDIFVINIKTGITYQLTSTGHNVAPSWSPDGKKIVFYRGDESISCLDFFPPKTKGFALVVMDSNGANLREIVSGGYLFGVYRTYPPHWSPSGDKILFQYQESTDYPAGVFVVNIDGNQLKLLERKSSYPSWSPDGSQIALVTSYGRESSGIHIMDSTGSNKKVLLLEHMIESPIWSPNGKWIALVSNKRINQQTGFLCDDLYLISPDVKHLIQLTSEIGIDGQNGILWMP